MPDLHYNHKVRSSTYTCGNSKIALVDLAESVFHLLSRRILYAEFCLKVACVAVQVHTYTLIPRVLYLRRIGKRISLAFGSKGRISYS